MSGTVTLEIALVGTPMVIIYKLAPLTYQIAKRLVHVTHIGLCNIVTGETVATELIQDEATPQKIVEEIRRILDDEHRHSLICQKLAEVKSKLGCGGASANVARLIPELIGHT